MEKDAKEPFASQGHGPGPEAGALETGKWAVRGKHSCRQCLHSVVYAYILLIHRSRSGSACMQSLWRRSERGALRGPRQQRWGAALHK